MNENDLKAWDISAQRAVSEMRDSRYRNARRQAGRVLILIAEAREREREYAELMVEIAQLRQTVRHTRRFVETVTGELE